MKIGFQLKGAAKRKVLISDPDITKGDNDECKREAILSIEGNKVKGAEEENGPLVIPLQKPLNAAPLTLDEIAAKELLAELHAPTDGASKDSGLVIESVGNTAMGTKKQPLLLANVDPALLRIEDDVERYKMDISLRPEDVDAKSDAYVAVPIEEFGAALLRGMGWAGPTAESEEKDKKGFDHVVREARLGLGATAKPPDDKRKGKNSKNDKTTAEWKKKADMALKAQQLQVGDMVWLRDPLYASQHARVEATRGVPGLDRIRVMLVNIATPSGEPKIIVIKRTDAVLLSDYSEPMDVVEEARDSRRSASPNKKQERGDDDRRRGDREYDDTYRDQGRGERGKNDLRDSSTRKRPRDEREEPSGKRRGENDRRNGRDRDRERERDRSRDGRKEDRFDDRNRPSKRDKDSAKINKNSWLCAGIKVRVVSEKVKGSARTDCYLKKFNVVRIDNEGLALLHQIGEDNVVEDVKEKYLENVLPAVDGKCIVLTGERKGSIGVLREKNKQTEELVISIGSTTIKVSLEDAAAVADN